MAIFNSTLSFATIGSTLFVVTFFADGIHRASGDAFAAGAMGKKQAISMVILAKSCGLRS
jgi:hypothetical protein